MIVEIEKDELERLQRRDKILDEIEDEILTLQLDEENGTDSVGEMVLTKLDMWA